MNPTFNQIAAALRRSWAADTAFDASDWSAENPARGQCVVTALVVQDYLGGDLQRYEVTGDFTETHYTNVLSGGAILDVTASQYEGRKVHLTSTPTNLKGFSSIREKRLADSSTRMRYEILKARVAKEL